MLLAYSNQPKQSQQAENLPPMTTSQKLSSIFKQLLNSEAWC